jgi:hypothetical protein
LERRTLLTVRKDMKTWPNFLLKTFHHSVQVSPGQATSNSSLERHDGYMQSASRFTFSCRDAQLP